MSVERNINPVLPINNNQPSIEGQPTVTQEPPNVDHEIQVLANLHEELKRTGSCNVELYNHMIAKLLSGK